MQQWTSSTDPRTRAAPPAVALCGLLVACQAQEAPLAIDPLVPAPGWPRDEGTDLDRVDVESAAAEPWHPDFRVPVQIAYANFGIGNGELLDSLTAFSVVPSVDFPVPLGESWTLIPFLGAGGGWIVDGGLGVWILSLGARAEWWKPVSESLTLHVQPRVRYDVNLNREDGLLGDWGRLDLAGEVRYAAGRGTYGVLFEPGLYLQGFWFFDDIEFEIPAVTPDSLQNQVEVGFSLGTRPPLEVFGLELPRVFIGYRFGGGVEVVEIRFGNL